MDGQSKVKMQPLFVVVEKFLVRDRESCTIDDNLTAQRAMDRISPSAKQDTLGALEVSFVSNCDGSQADRRKYFLTQISPLQPEDALDAFNDETFGGGGVGDEWREDAHEELAGEENILVMKQKIFN